MNAPSVLTAAAECCPDEEWAPIPGWPHEASTCGRIRSIDRIGPDGVWRIGVILPQYPDKRKGKGYLYVHLRDGDRRRKVAVAVAVLEAHRGPRPFPDWEACHGNSVRTDNHLGNLRWDTRDSNLADQRRHAQERKARPAVTKNSANTDETDAYPSQIRRFPRMAAIRAVVTAAVTGDGLHGTGRSLPSDPFVPQVSSVRSSSLSLIRSLRSRISPSARRSS